MERKKDEIIEKKKRFTLPKLNLSLLLGILIVACPILDMTSFLFRYSFSTFVSPSTVIRPIIPIVVLIILFFTTKNKIKIFGIAAIYGIYAIFHLVVFQKFHTLLSYGTTLHEMQYLMNYSFMIVNLFIFTYVFSKKDIDILNKSLLISITIYIVSLFISIITKTSSTTYLEGIGYKGWYESGNSLGAILILSLFLLLPLMKQKKYRYWVIGIVMAMGVFLTIFLGTRVGLFGFILVVAGYMFLQALYSWMHKTKINKKIIMASFIVLLLIGIGTVIVGSHTLQRRNLLKAQENEIRDEATGQKSYITGDLTQMKNAILEQKMPEEYLSKAEQTSILELNEYATKNKMTNNDMRSQQFVYHTYLLKNQRDPASFLFGNGYLTHYCELILEMEIPAFFFNFGILRFYFIFCTIF